MFSDKRTGMFFVKKYFRNTSPLSSCSNSVLCTHTLSQLMATGSHFTTLKHCLFMWHKTVWVLVKVLFRLLCNVYIYQRKRKPLKSTALCPHTQGSVGGSVAISVPELPARPHRFLWAQRDLSVTGRCFSHLTTMACQPFLRDLEVNHWSQRLKNKIRRCSVPGDFSAWLYRGLLTLSCALFRFPGRGGGHTH